MTHGSHRIGDPSDKPLVRRRGRSESDASDDVGRLRRHPFFAGASHETVAACARRFAHRTIASHAILFDQGDVATTAYLILRGTIRSTRLHVDGREMTVGILGPGDIIGDEVLLRGAVVRSTRAGVIDEACVCAIRAEDLAAMIARHPNIALNLARYVGARRDAAFASVEAFAFLNVRERIVDLLVRLCERYGVVEARGMRIDLRLKQAEIASLVGSTRETVSVELGRLKRSGRLVARDGFFILTEAAQAAGTASR